MGGRVIVCETVMEVCFPFGQGLSAARNSRQARFCCFKPF